MSIITQEQVNELWRHSEARAESRDFLMNRLMESVKIQELMDDLNRNLDE